MYIYIYVCIQISLLDSQSAVLFDFGAFYANCGWKLGSRHGRMLLNFGSCCVCSVSGLLSIGEQSLERKQVKSYY